MKTVDEWPLIYTIAMKLLSSMDLPVHIWRSVDPAELGVVTTPMAQDIPAMETETFAHFDGVWSPPPELDDLSGSYGDEGRTSILGSATQT